ncbi:MAG: FecR family protein [Elusimicrobiota bacterium]|jgi:hypothetical protein
MKSFIIAAAVLLFASSADAQLTRIGAAGAVRGRVEAMAPGQAVGRIMESGKEVYLRDAVTTDANGRMQILLLDETVFTIGPNSSLTLDEFVYDPKVGEGRMTARVTKGVFRFVTGKIARENPANMKVKLPVGVIGIRGTMVMAKIFSPTKATTILEGPGPRNNSNERPGAMVVSAGGQDSMATRPNTAIDVTLAGPSAPYIAPPSLVNEVSGDLAPKTDEPAKGGSGGGSGSASSTEGSASQDSGQTTAGALGDLSNTESLTGVTGDSNDLAASASQTSASDIADGIAKWDDVRTLTSGSGYYSGTAGISCQGGCTSTQVSFSMDYCFASKSMYSPSFHFVNGDLSSTYSSGFSLSPDANYASSTGNAVWSVSGTSGGGSVSGTISIMNAGGVAAKQAAFGFSFSDSSYSASGTINALR